MKHLVSILVSLISVVAAAAQTVDVPNFKLVDYVVTETNSTKQYYGNFTLTAAISRAVIIRYHSESTVSDQSDFSLIGKQVTIPAKKLTGPFKFDIIGDVIGEPIENFYVVIDEVKFSGTSQCGASCDVYKGAKIKVTINDDDASPVQSITAKERATNLRQLAYDNMLTEAVTSVDTMFVDIDLNNDDDMDVIGIFSRRENNVGGYITIFRNVSPSVSLSGWVIEKTQHYSNAGMNTMLVDDFNNDGYQDVYVYNPYFGDKMLLQSNGGLVEQTTTQLPITGTYSKGYQKEIVSHAIGDLDSDGDKDIFLIVQNDPSGQYRNSHVALYNDGTGVFTHKNIIPASYRYFTSHWALSATIGDFNGDSLNDIFIGTNNSEQQKLGNNNMLLTRTVTGSYAISLIPKNTTSADGYAFTSNSVTQVSSVDFDKNGTLDIVASSYNINLDNKQSWIDVYSNDGTGKFVRKHNIPQTTLHTPYFYLNDYDKDGNVDIIERKSSQRFVYDLWENNETLLNGIVSSGVVLNKGSTVEYLDSEAVDPSKLSPSALLFWFTKNADYLPKQLK